MAIKLASEDYIRESWRKALKVLDNKFVENKKTYVEYLEKYKGVKRMNEKIAPQVDKFADPMAVRILNDVEEVHHYAIMAGDIQYMQKLGTILERYKEVRKDDVGG